MDKFLACLFIGAAVIALVMAWWVIGGLILSIVWNALLPYLVGAPTISWSQGVAGMILLTIVGGFFRTTVSK